MKNAALIVLGWTVLAGIPTEARAHSWKFTRLVDSRTPIPGGTGTFTYLQAPSFDGRNVAFRGARAVGAEAPQDGIYSDVGGLHAVANLNAPVPGGTGTFTAFGTFPTIDRGEVVFYGCGDPNGCLATGSEGIYSDRGGLHAVADTRTPAPGGTGHFRGFGTSSVRNGQITFVGRGPGTRSGVYTNIGGLQVVADTQTPIPSGAGTFTSFGSSSIAADHVAFDGLASGPGSGIYTDIGGLTVVADQSTPVPGGTSLFQSMHSPSFDGEHVAFWGCGPRPGDLSCGFPWAEGIYSDVGGLHVVADTDTPVPEGSGTFSWFGGPSIDAGNVAFVGALPAGGIGLYLHTHATLTLEKVLGPGDLLDGKTVVACTLGEGGLRGPSLALIVTFSDGTHAIYRADRIDATLGIRGVPNPARVGRPFTLLGSLENEGAAVHGTLVLALVSAGRVVPLGVTSFPVPSGIDWRDQPLACFLYPRLPTSAWLLALFDRSTGALMSVALDVVAVDGAASREEELQIREQADAFLETLPALLPRP